MEKSSDQWLAFVGRARSAFFLCTPQKNDAELAQVD